LKNTLISHPAEVIETGTHFIRVKILSVSACGNCVSRKGCSMAESQDKEMTFNQSDEGFSKGDQVEIIMRESQGFRAVLLSYLLPFVWMGLVILITVLLHASEAITGLAALASIGVYYLVLYQFRQLITNKFEFEVRKPSETSISCHTST